MTFGWMLEVEFVEFRCSDTDEDEGDGGSVSGIDELIPEEMEEGGKMRG